MGWQKLTRQHDLRWILRTHGTLGVLRLLRRSLPYYLWLYATDAGWKERNFDALHGVETEGMMPRWEMGDVGENVNHAVQYLPTKPRKFRRLIESLEINYSDFTFLDIGSGKGRGLILASGYGFRRLVGVEFVKQLCDTAVRNMEVSGCKAEINCMDAMQYEIPAEPLVIYMCNPFFMELMRPMVRRLEQSYLASPREIFVVYDNPVHVQAFHESSVFAPVRVKRDEYAIFRTQVVRLEPAEASAPSSQARR